MKHEIVEPQNDKPIILEFTQNNMANMILNFLGHKQSLHYVPEDGYFIVDKENIAQFYYLLEQKIAKEQYTHLNSFIVNIGYSNNTNFIIHSIEALNTFLETRSDITPISVVLEWKIILQFPNATTIESQNISVFFKIKKDGQGEVNLAVQHTNQAWGLEILNLFQSHIDTIRQNKSQKLKKAISMKTISEIIGILGILLWLFLSHNILKDDISTLDISEQRIELINKLQSIDMNQRNSQDLTLLLSIVNEQNMENFYEKIRINEPYKNIFNEYLKEIEQIKKQYLNNFLYGTFAFFLTILALYYQSIQAIKYFKLQSFILLTKKAEKEYQMFINSKNQKEYYSLTLICFTLITGVIGNFIYQVLSK
jgi:hypothetical protein